MSDGRNPEYANGYGCNAAGQYPFLASLKQAGRTSLRPSTATNGKWSVMKVGSDNSIYSVFSTASRRPPSIADEAMVVSEPAQAKAPSGASDRQLIADFNARMAKQSLDWADSDKDGRLTKDEYMSGQARLAELNDRPNDTAGNEERWSKIDTAGKGWVDEAELGQGLAKVLPVGVGHLDQGFAERLRSLRT